MPVVLLAGGCAPGQGDVSGQVTFKGRPVTSGVISFHCQDGRRDVFNARIQDGRYAIQGIPEGETLVTVVGQTGQAEKPAPAPEKPGGAGDGAPAADPALQTMVNTLPRRYADPDQSGLNFRVGAGAQTHDLDLTP